MIALSVVNGFGRTPDKTTKQTEKTQGFHCELQVFCVKPAKGLAITSRSR